MVLAGATRLTRSDLKFNILLIKGQRCVVLISHKCVRKANISDYNSIQNMFVLISIKRVIIKKINSYMQFNLV